MLTIVDKPLIQYAVEEAVSSGIDVLIFIIGRNKEQISKHFDWAYELENELKLKNKKKELEQIEKILPKNVQCIYIRQKEALGLGHAVLCSEPAVEDDPFAVILADDLIHTKGDSCLTQMCSKYQELQRSIISVEEVDKSNIHKYGVIDGEKINVLAEEITDQDKKEYWIKINSLFNGRYDKYQNSTDREIPVFRLIKSNS